MRERNRRKWLWLTSAFVAGAVAAGLSVQGAEPWASREQPDLQERVGKAPALRVEELGVPITSVRQGELMWVPNPNGTTYDLLQWYFRDYGGPTTVFLIDLATGEMKTDGIPLRRQIHICGRVLAPNGKLYLATPDWQKGMEVYVYDPAKNVLGCLGVVAPGLGGETRPMTIGTDGMIYGSGSYAKERTAGAYQIDPTTEKVTDYGPIGPSHAPNGCWGYSIAADDRYVYVASGKIPWHLVAYDRQTGKDATLVTTETVGGMVSVGQDRHGCTASATKVVGTNGQRIDYWLYQGKAVPKKSPKEAPPWPVPQDSKPWVVWPPKPEVFLDNASPGSDGRAVIWYRTPVGRANRHAAPPGPPPDPKPEDLGWKAIRLQVPTYPMSIYRLIELPDGRLLGTAGAYEGNFLFDPATGKSTHLGKIPLSHYATALLGGKAYMSGYPSSPLYVFDPARPWTVGVGDPIHPPLPDTDERSNPRMLGCLNKWAGTHKMYAAAVGADGRVYFGGTWIRNGACGGLAWWDPKSGAGGGFWEPFSNYQITGLTSADGGRLIVISTRRVRDAVLNKPEPKQGKLFVFDTVSAKIVREIEPVMDAKGAGLVLGVGGSRVLGWTEDPAEPKVSVLYGVDAASGDVAFRRKLPFPLPVPIGSNQTEPFDFRLGPDGKVWTYLGGALVRIDPRDTSIEPAGRIALGGRIAFSGPDIYLAGSERLRRVAGVVPRPKLAPEEARPVKNQDLARQTVTIASSKDGAPQRILFSAPPEAAIGQPGDPVPLLVALHTWSSGYSQCAEYLPLARERKWVVVAPDFRGPNTRAEACASDLAVQDVLDAVEYAGKNARVDESRIYLVGVSGGGHMALMMAARAPGLWAGVSAWVPIADLAAWHAESLARKSGYAKMMENACGGPPGQPHTDAEYRRRSPLFFLAAAKGLPLDLNAGIHDGHTGSVPISQSLRAFNVLAQANGLDDRQVAPDEIAFMVREQRVPPALANDRQDDPERGKAVLFRRVAGPVRVTLFEGGHEQEVPAALDWLARQRKGAPVAHRAERGR